jgi:SpoIIAA-like
MMAKDPIRIFYVIGKEFTGLEPEAGTTGDRIRELWHDLIRIAVVTDHAWLCAAVSMFKSFLHGEVRLFNLSEFAAAKD